MHEGKGGLVIRSVDSGSFAEELGLFEKDVILSVNRNPVTTVEDVLKIQSLLKPANMMKCNNHQMAQVTFNMFRI